MKQNLTQGDLEMMGQTLEEQHAAILDVVNVLEQNLPVQAIGQSFGQSFASSGVNVSLIVLKRVAELILTVRDSLGQAELEADAEARQ